MHRLVRLALPAIASITLPLHAAPVAAQAPFRPTAAGAVPFSPVARLPGSAYIAMAPGEQSTARAPRWPWYAVGGAIVGAGTMTVLILASCDAGCRDDGGYGYGFGLFVPAAAAVGTVGGAIIGLVVDHHRRGAPE